MNKSTVLSQLAFAGIAAGLLSMSTVSGNEKVALGTEDSCVADTTNVAGQDSTAIITVAPSVDKHACKGQNACKGQGGCAMSQKALEAIAKKNGFAMEKVGKAHSCKTLNACKGLGGCSTL